MKIDEVEKAEMTVKNKEIGKNEKVEKTVKPEKIKRVGKNGKRKNVSKRKAKKKTEKTNRMKAAVKIIGISMLVILLVVAAIIFFMYKSGEMFFKNGTKTDGLKIDVTQEEIESAKEKFAYANTIPWQDDWLVYQDKIYEYKEDTINFLLLGVDKKGKLDHETDLSDWEAGQADAVFVVSLDPKEKRVSVIGIPRNSMAYIEMFDSDKSSLGYIYNQLCLQYGYAGGGELGLEATKRVVSEIFYNLPIHGACAINLKAMEIVTEKIGGVEVTIKEDLSILGPEFVEGNRVVIKGDNTVDYLIYRDTSVIGSPTTRLTREKEFLEAMIHKAIACIKKDPTIISDVYKAILPYMNTDITLDKAVYLAMNSLDYRIDGDSFYQLQGEDREVTGLGENGEERTFNDFYLDEDYLLETAVKVFYQEVSYKASN